MTTSKEPKQEPHIVHKQRTIQVWHTKKACVEREGDTLSLQVKLPQGMGQMALPIDVVQDIIDVLQQAAAIEPNPGTGIVIIPVVPVEPVVREKAEAYGRRCINTCEKASCLESGDCGETGTRWRKP